MLFLSLKMEDGVRRTEVQNMWWSLEAKKAYNQMKIKTSVLQLPKTEFRQQQEYVYMGPIYVDV